MELVGEQMLPLTRQRVWEALNDPAVLKRCVPGCDLFEREGENTYKVGMTAAVGPVKARFQGRLVLSDIVAPDSYALSFEGSGGAAGFGKGNARVALADAPQAGTRLTYTVAAQVGGKLAQVGSRLIDGVARKMADEFFSRFAKVLAPAAVEASPTELAAMGGAAGPFTGQPTAPPVDATPASASSNPSRPAVQADPPAATTTGSAAATVTSSPAASSLIVVCTAISTLAAAVAVLAAVFALYIVR